MRFDFSRFPHHNTFAMRRRGRGLTCISLLVLLVSAAGAADIKKIDEEAKKYIDQGRHVEAILLYAKHAKKADRETRDLLIERIDTTAEKMKEMSSSAAIKDAKAKKARQAAWEGIRASETLSALLQSFVLLANKKEYADIAARIGEELPFVTDSYTRQHLNTYKSAAMDLDNLLVSFLKGIDEKIGGPFIIMGLNGTLESFKNGNFVLNISGMKKNFKMGKMRVVDMVKVQGWTGEDGLYYKLIGEDMLLRGNLKGAKGKFRIAKKKKTVVDNFLVIFEREKAQRFKEHFTLGEEYRGKKEYMKAVDEYKKALAIRPDDFTSLYQSAECLYALKKHDEAEKMFARTEKVDPASITVQRRYAEILKKIKKYRESVGHYRKVMDLDPDDYKAAWQTAWLYHVLKDNDNALRFINHCIEMNKKAGNDWNNIHPLRHLCLDACQGEAVGQGVEVS